jgi:glucan phosphorylase
MNNRAKRQSLNAETSEAAVLRSYERHLLFDKVINPSSSSSRDKFEAFARSVRDLLAQRWLRTTQTYTRQNPKFVYYLSMEFLVGRSLANNVANLLDAADSSTRPLQSLEWGSLLEDEPDPGLGNGGLGRLAACFLDSMATLQLPAVGYGLRYEYGMYRQSIRDGWQEEQPDNWLHLPDPWEVARPEERVQVKFGSTFSLRGGALEVIPGQPSSVALRSTRRGTSSGYGRDAKEWARKAVLNIAGSGWFSSDRAVAEYAAEIWQAEACPVSERPMTRSRADLRRGSSSHDFQAELNE